MKWSLLPLVALLLFSLGCGSPSFLVTPVFPQQQLREAVVEEPPRDARGRGGKIAIIELEGALLNHDAGGMFQPRDNPVSRFVEALALAERDEEVRAVVLRINSPGGSVAASETLHYEVKRFRNRTGRPVLAFVQEVGASGAFFVACAADEIIVQPTSVVGSIGVIFQSVSVAGTMSMLGVQTEAIRSGPHKDAGSPLRTMTADERRIFQEMIDAYHRRFIATVQNRSLRVPSEKTGVAFDGRVFTGEQAVEIGLAHRTGSLRQALARARELADAPRARAIRYLLPLETAGSIYASAPMPVPQGNVWQIRLPGIQDLPPGFYYLWLP